MVDAGTGAGDDQAIAADSFGGFFLPVLANRHMHAYNAIFVNIFFASSRCKLYLC
jgi:hypothetical protein